MPCRDVCLVLLCSYRQKHFTDISHDTSDTHLRPVYRDAILRRLIFLRCAKCVTLFVGVTCLHLSTKKHKRRLILSRRVGKWTAPFNRELSDRVWSNLGTLSGLYCSQTSSLYESSITLIRSDRLG